MKKHKKLVISVLITLFINFNFPIVTLAYTSEVGSNVGIYFKNSYTPSEDKIETPEKSTSNKSKTYPNTGEVGNKNIVYIGGILVLTTIYFLFIRNKARERGIKNETK